jgi:hypothetical protein
MICGASWSDRCWSPSSRAVASRRRAATFQSWAGLWNEAYVSAATGSPGQLSLVALRKGDMAIEIKGPNKAALVALAQVAVARLE